MKRRKKLVWAGVIALIIGVIYVDWVASDAAPVQSQQQAGDTSSPVQQERGRVASAVVEAQFVDAQKEVSALTEDAGVDNTAAKSYIPLLVTVLGIATGIVIYMILKRLF